MTAGRSDDAGSATVVDGVDTAGELDTPGAPDDEEMPLSEHIEEMIRRLGIVLLCLGAVSLVTFPFADRLINFLWYSYLPGDPAACSTQAAFETTPAHAVVHSLPDEGGSIACPRLYHPLSLLLARIKVAALVGFVVALPVLVYQTYRFMRPGLYPNERRYYLSSVPTSLLLAAVGIAFAYFLVLPFIFTYFLFYSQDVAGIAFGLGDTLDIILLMMGLFAAIFQIPLFMMLGVLMGVVSQRWFADKRLLFWGLFAGIAFLFSPDPTGMAPFIVGLTMIALFELTLLLLRWTGR